MLNIFLSVVAFSERIAIGFHLLMGSMKSKIIGWRFLISETLGKYHLNEACVVNGMAEMVTMFPQPFSGRRRAIVLRWFTEVSSRSFTSLCM